LELTAITTWTMLRRSVRVVDDDADVERRLVTAVTFARAAPFVMSGSIDVVFDPISRATSAVRDPSRSATVTDSIEGSAAMVAHATLPSRRLRRQREPSSDCSL
jgi:hypothetical protein